MDTDKLERKIEALKRSVDMLVLIEEFNLASLEALPKNLKGVVKIHKKWKIQHGLKT